MGLFNPALSSPVGSVPAPSARTGVAGAVAIHAAAFALLAAVVPAEQVAEFVRPLAVRVIESAPPASEAPPKPLPPVVQQKPLRPVAPPPEVVTPAPVPVPQAFTASAQAAPAASAGAPAAVSPAPTFATAPASVSPPRFDAGYLNNPKPPYPATSRRRGEEGKVVLRVHVTPEGRSAAIEVKASSGHERLDAAAREAVAHWRFVPAQRGDEPVAAWVVVPIVFSLES